ncbi:MAG: redoxin domain-containing protein [Planctomycetia bacterium]
MVFVRQRGLVRHHAHRLLSWIFVAVAMACSLGLPEMPAAEIPAKAISPVEAFPFETLDGSAIEFDTSARCHVIAFLGAGCPVARQYAGRLEAIAADYADQGVRVIGVDANRQDSADEFLAAAREMEVTFPLVMDSRQRIARALGATRTGGVVVIDQIGNVAYAGRVDDQFTPGVARPAATTHELTAALDDLLAGRPIAVPRTEPVGCLITFDRDSDLVAEAAPTFHRDIVPLLQTHCLECHRSGEIGPFDVSTLDEVRGWAAMMLETMEQQRMPPWHAAPEHGSFKNARQLPAEATALFRTWLEAGMPAGDPTTSPPGPALVEGWRLPRAPDAIVPLGRRPYRVPASGTVDYQYFVADPHFEDETWVSAAQCVPGAPSVVHHGIVFVRPESLSDFRGMSFVTAYVPGQRATAFPPGHARRIPARSKFVFQMHYTPDGREREDLTSVGVVTMPREEVTHEVVTLAAIDQDFEIPPHAANHEVRAELKGFSTGSTLLAVSPHMHLRGKAFEVRARRGSETETLLSVPHYDFNWQHTYEFTEPLPLDGIDALEIVARFDNSAANPTNPDPAETVMWGEQTWEEMALAFVEVAKPLVAPEEATPALAATSAEPEDSVAAARADSFLARFDANHDGMVVRTEASRIVRDYSFSILDADGDGQITRDEALRAMRGRR